MSGSGSSHRLQASSSRASSSRFITTTTAGSEPTDRAATLVPSQKTLVSQPLTITRQVGTSRGTPVSSAANITASRPSAAATAVSYTHFSRLPDDLFKKLIDARYRSRREVVNRIDAFVNRPDFSLVEKHRVIAWALKAQRYSNVPGLEQWKESVQRAAELMRTLQMKLSLWRRQDQDEALLSESLFWHLQLTKVANSNGGMPVPERLEQICQDLMVRLDTGQDLQGGSTSHQESGFGISESTAADRSHFSLLSTPNQLTSFGQSQSEVVAPSPAGIILNPALVDPTSLLKNSLWYSHLLRAAGQPSDHARRIWIWQHLANDLVFVKDTSIGWIIRHQLLNGLLHDTFMRSKTVQPDELHRKFLEVGHLASMMRECLKEHQSDLGEVSLTLHLKLMTFVRTFWAEGMMDRLQLLVSDFKELILRAGGEF